jgi:hypothetical protein
MDVVQVEIMLEDRGRGDIIVAVTRGIIVTYQVLVATEIDHGDGLAA